MSYVKKTTGQIDPPPSGNRVKDVNGKFKQSLMAPVANGIF